MALCDVLLDSDGIDESVECSDTVGRTPLHLACGVTPSHEELIMALLDKGANLAATQRDGKSCLDVAEETGDKKVMAALKEFLSEQEDGDFEALMGDEETKD